MLTTFTFFSVGVIFDHCFSKMSRENDHHFRGESHAAAKNRTNMDGTTGVYQVRVFYFIMLSVCHGTFVVSSSQHLPVQLKVKVYSFFLGARVVMMSGQTS